MREYRYRLVNVFAESPLAGNPLCVFEAANGLDDATMQALALQFNLSETAFILPSARATARVRIFTPTFEMPFAGHPTLGSAHVVRALGGGDALTLEMLAGIIPVAAQGDRWTLSARAPKSRSPDADRAALARFLRITVADIGDDPLWIDTGSEQLVVPLNSVDAVRRADPDAGTTGDWPRNDIGRSMLYAWSRVDAQNVEARFFFTKYASVIEDPGTGSACANLGGWMVETGQRLPVSLTVSQGSAVGRPCQLGLDVGADAAITVAGRVIELGSGVIALP